MLLPKGEDFNDWLAVHVVDFFNRINLIYGTVCEQCTDTTCPTMSGGPKFEYLWQDGVKYKKPTQLPANQVRCSWINILDGLVYFIAVYNSTLRYLTAYFLLAVYRKPNGMDRNPNQ